MQEQRPKVALCFPNFSWRQAEESFLWQMIPHTLCLLAATIRDMCDVDIVDANKERLSTQEFMDRIALGKYDLVGVSVLMDLFASTGHLAVSLVKKSRPEAITVMGGVYTTMNPRGAMEGNDDLDFACIGEGEELLPDLIRCLFQEGPMPKNGLAYREKGKVVVQSRTPFITNLDALPRPAYDLIDFASYASWYTRKAVDGPLELPFVDIMTSRGCPQSCCFCQAVHISGNTIRVKSAQTVLEEIEFFKNKYGIRSLNFVDDNLIAVRKRAIDIFDGMVQRDLAVPWKTGAIAVFRLDEDLLDHMVASGCKYIGIAIESGVPRVLKEIIGKPVDLEHAKRMTVAAQKRGIFVTANFVIGFPGETWEEIRRTLAFAEEINVDYAKIFSAVPLPHTKLWEMCEDSDAFAPGFDSGEVSWNQGQITSPYFDRKELTLLRAYEWDRINFRSEKRIRAIADAMSISVEELDHIRRNTRRTALGRLATE